MPTDTFLLDWTGSVEVDTAWQTDKLDAAETHAEERSQLWTKPRRTFRVRWVGLTAGEASRLHMLLAASQHRQVEFPLYCDQARTTASSSGTTINCPTADRRFQVGKQVVIHAIGSNGRSTNVQVRTVSAIGGSSLTVSSGLTGSYAAGALVYPLVLVENLLEADVQHHTDSVAVVETTFAESFVAGLSQTPLNPFHADVDDPVGFPVYGDYPVFDVGPDWSDGVRVGISRKGDRYESGRGSAVELRGTRPTFSIGMTMLELTREDAFAVLRFHDSRRGRLFPFWFPHPAGLWDIAAITTTYVDVDAHGLATDIGTFCDYVAVVLRDGTVYIRAISTVTDNTTTFRLTFDDAIPATDADDVERVTPAFFCRFAEDSIGEQWLTDEFCRIELKLVELVFADEKGVEIEA